MRVGVGKPILGTSDSANAAFSLDAVSAGLAADPMFCLVATEVKDYVNKAVDKVLALVCQVGWPKLFKVPKQF